MAAPGAPTDVVLTPAPGGCAVEIGWKPDPSAASYEILALPTRTLHKYQPSTQPACVRGLEAGASYSFEITAINADGRSDPTSAGPVTVLMPKASRSWLVSSLAVVVGLLVLAIVCVSQWTRTEPPGVWPSLLLASTVLLVASLTLTLIDRQYGLWRAIIGQDQRVSTSQLQTFLWTALVAFILAYFTGRSWFDGETGLFEGLVPGQETDDTPVWDDYLILLGGPFAALVAARGILTAKVQNGVVQKSVAADGSASISQAVTNDAGKVDLVDTQYLIFNVVALVYVIVGFASTNRLPAIPSLLLALTGSSAAAYVLNKSVQNNAPAITSVLPASLRPGESVIISGINFRPAGVSALPTVSIGGVQAIVEADGTDTRLVAQTPLGLAPGVHNVVVTSAIRVSTDPAVVSVLADKPVVLGVDPSSLRAGDTLTIDGTGFTSLHDHVPNVSVLFGTTPVLAGVTTHNGVQRIQVGVPALASGTTEVDVKVRTPRSTESDPVKLTYV